MIEALSTTPSPYMKRLLKITITLRKRRGMFTRMVNPIIGKLLFVAIGTSMWIWMQAYVKVQIALYGENVLKPHNRTVPGEFYSDSFGRHEYANLTNITMHYVTKGCHDEASENRTVLVLLHGFLDFWYIWNRQIPVLGEDFWYVRQWQGDDHDSSHKRRVVLVGHDWGGMIAFCFATVYEKMIDKMVIINGMHPLAFSKQLFRSLSQMRKSWFMIPFRQPVVPEQYLMLNDLMFFDKVHKSFTTEEKNAHKYVFSQQGALTGALNYYRSFNNDSDDLRKIPYRKINVSTLILWAEKDEFLTRRIAVYNQRWLKNSELVYYARSGHWLIRECPEQVARRIRRFALDTMPSAINTENDRKSDTKCEESMKPTPSRSWILRLFAWLPRNSKLPKLMEE